jgi:hypothetical protein
MKKLLLGICFFSLLVAHAQNNSRFVAADRFGNRFDISRLSLDSPFPPDSPTQPQPAPTASCSTGYFIAYYAQGSFWDNNTAAQSVLCQVLWDISNFLSSSLSLSPASGPKIKLYCSNTPTSVPSALAGASGIYVFPASSSVSNQGLIDNQIYKMIISGIDSYSNVPISYVNGTSFYHGLVYVNPTPPGGANWNTALTSTSVGTSDFCLYSILLHEVVHALGFSSLIGPSGFSVLGSASNFYSRYDRFLFDSNGTPLVSSSTPST